MANTFQTQPLPGTRDFHPEDMRLRNYITDVWKDVSVLSGFQEYDAPILEPFAMYARKGGEELRDQMWTFKYKGDGQVLTLRPEMTPSLVRLVQQRRKDALFPLRLFSVPQCWRDETLTRGRKREFYQWNVDIISKESTPAADAEVIATAIGALQRFGFTSENVEVRVSSRKLVQAILETCGVSDSIFEEVCIVVDKMEKLSQDDMLEQFARLDIEEEQAMEIIDAMQLDDLDDILEQFPTTAPAVEELRSVFALLGAYGMDSWCRFDARIIRGLAYYTGVVFEATSKTSELKRAICGGGRYDKLFTSLGAEEDLAAAGFGMGDCVLGELLVEMKLVPKHVMQERVEVCVVPRCEALRPQAMQVANKLRAAGIQTLVPVQRIKAMRPVLGYVDKIGVQLMAYVAESEWERGAVAMRMLRESTTGESGKKGQARQEEVQLDKLVDFVRTYQEKEREKIVAPAKEE